MGQIINISQAYRSALSIAPTPAETVRRPPADLAFEGDTAEFSRAALQRAVGLSSLRIATTAAIRTEIEDGTYETPERINGTIDRLLDVIG